MEISVANVMLFCSKWKSSFALKYNTPVQKFGVSTNFKCFLKEVSLVRQGFIYLIINTEENTDIVKYSYI